MTIEVKTLEQALRAFENAVLSYAALDEYTPRSKADAAFKKVKEARQYILENFEAKEHCNDDSD